MRYGKTRKEALQMVHSTIVKKGRRQLKRFLMVGGFGFAKDGQS